jgi:hypothetical protein
MEKFISRLDLASDREAILIKLIFAARRLAESNLLFFNHPGARSCSECGAIGRTTSVCGARKFWINHRSNCLTGEVLCLLAELETCVCSGAPANVVEIAGPAAAIRPEGGAA